MNEDFGYIKEEEQSNTSIIVKKCILAGTVIFSVLCFIYISMNAYHFIYNDSGNDIKTIKSPEGPIKVTEDGSAAPTDVTTISDMDKAVYENIVGNKKESLEKGKTVKMPEKPMVAPSNLADRNKKEINTNKPATNDRVIVYDANSRTKNQVAKESAVSQDQVPTATKNNVKIDTKTAAKTENKNSRNRVQLAAMNSQKSAGDYWTKLNKDYPKLFAGLKSYVQEVNLGQRGMFYRLQVGGFYSQVEAENFCLKFISQSGKTKADCIVVE
jgi:hypothetical protein